MSYHYKVHFPTCGCRYNKTNRYQVDILDRKTKRYNHKIIDNNMIDNYLATLETYSVCIHSNTTSDLLNGGIIFITDEKHIQNITNKFNENKEINEIKFYSVDELGAISETLKEYHNFTPIKDSLHILKDLNKNYKILICVQKDFDGNVIFSYPKGKRFIHETSIDCAYREFEEEIGFPIPNDVRDIKYQEDIRKNTNNNIPIVFRNANFLFQIILS